MLACRYQPRAVYSGQQSRVALRSNVMSAMLSLFAAVEDGRWSWGLGDPDWGAVLITGLYLVTSLICLLAAWRSRPPADPVSVTRFWFFLAVVLLLLGVNKQADFQTLLTLHGREILREAGLYDVRRPIQVAFILAVAAAAAASMVLGRWLTWRWSWPCRFATIGLGIQASFVVIRAASFHHVDTLVGLRFGDVKFNLLLESIGLNVILWAATTAITQIRALEKA